MTELLLHTLRTQGRRYLASGVAVALGVAFVAATLVLGDTMRTSARTAVAGDVGGYAAVVSAGDGQPTERTRQTMEGLPGVASVSGERAGDVELVAAGRHAYAALAQVPRPGGSTELVGGAWPVSAGEVAMTERGLAAMGVHVGDAVGVLLPDGVHRVRITGVVDVHDPSLVARSVVAVATAEAIAAWTGDHSYLRLLVAAGADASPAEVLREVRAAGPRLEVRSGADEADARVRAFTSDSNVLQTMILGFGAVALFVAAIVIANTFTILLARRSRETALLRCLGAGRGQLARSALGEALCLGLVFSLAGTGLGVGLAALVSRLSDRFSVGLDLSVLSVTPVALLMPGLVGVVVTIAATLAPVVRASGVTPLAALRDDAPVRARSRAGVVRIVVAALLVAGGVAGLVHGARQHAVLPGMAGGMASFLGLLLIGGILVPLCARALGGLPAMLAGVPGRLAVDNSVRNPSRAAATTSALLIGVTLIVMVSTGAATAMSSLDRALDGKYAVDIVVSSPNQALGEADQRRLSAIGGVTTTAAIPTAQLKVAGTPGAQAVAIGTQAQRVSHDSEGLAGMHDGSIWLDPAFARALGVADGQRVAVTGSEASARLVADVRAGAPAEAALKPSTFAMVAGQGRIDQVWMRLADDADVSQAMVDVSAAVSDVPEAQVDGAAPLRQQMVSVLDGIVLVVTGLLGVSVLIAVVGVANTLSLSVLERTRESGLLRALGLTRGQLRATLMIESALLAAVAIVLGTALGIGYGYAGVQALLGGQVEVTLGVPWLRIGEVALVGVVAGVLAALLPAARAVRVAPAQVLTAD